MNVRSAGSVEIASDCRNILGESPVWSALERALYWTDIREPALYRLDVETSVTTKWIMPELAGAVVLRQRGGVIVGLKTGLYAFKANGYPLEPLVVFDGGHPDDRTNDSRCDRQGRLWFSRMRDFGRVPTGAIYRLDQDLRFHKAIPDLRVPNALCFSPAGDRLYFADTMTGDDIGFFNLDVASGALADRRDFAAVDAAPGRPDGATVDEEGFVWSARWGGGCIVRYAPDGSVDRIVGLPVTNPTSCSFGGKELDRLFITSACQGLDQVRLAQEPLAGSLLVIEPEVRGLPEPCFLG
jgi:sugar lactone lactonase YvrE